jgi:hypothetical protein
MAGKLNRAFIMVTRRRFIKTGLIWVPTVAQAQFTIQPCRRKAFSVASGPSLTGLIARWEADNITGLSDNTSVDTWLDQSGNSRTATGSGGTRPKYRTNIFGSKPAVQFLAGSLSALSFTATSIPNFTVFIAWSVTTLGAYAGPISWKGGGIAGFQYNTDENGDFKPHLGVYDTGGTAIQSKASSEGGTNSRGKALDVWKFDGTTVSGRKNGAAMTLGAGNSTPDFGGGAMLGYCWFGNSIDGYIAAILVYNSALSSGEITSNEGYLNGKYGIY